ncbi:MULTISPECIES: carbohydrate ABC transporter permease [Microbacterium]|uniref:carbohydrate ABC transporter permease n=1 Tax=Microbacterium TaxID=33882 RepID=UPI001E309A0D|nr:sugar ABC transporter permease [Microbacterium nymphoidis]MCD2498341.1 sugar ABC transporter permease [Microbacterium nymphoidis]
MTGISFAGRGSAQPGAAPPGLRRDRGRAPGQSGWWALLFVGPVGIGLAVFYLWPIVRTAWMSLTETGPFGGSTFTGLSNYEKLFSNPDLPQALLNTLIYTLIALLVIPIAMVIAALLNTAGLKGRGIYRTLYFLPVVTMAAAVAAVWKVIYNGDYGVLNQLLGFFGIAGTSWLTNPATALGAIAAVGIWSGIGTTLVIFLAALQGVPGHLYEAAQLDGAGPVRRFVSVTVPMISPSVFFVAVTTVIGAFQAFDLIYVMVAKTSPAMPHVKTIVYLFYEAGFIDHNPGLAAAIAFVLLLIILVVTVLQFGMQRKWVHYE